MNGGQRVRLNELFAQALEVSPAERLGYLDEACGTDAALRRELLSLLAAAEEAPGFFDALAQDVVAPSYSAFDAQREPGEDAGPTEVSLPHYDLLDKLGGGGMGVVYKARDTRLDRLVALKFLPRYLSADEEAKARFTREARAASALDHPGIAVVHEIGETDDGYLFIAMAYVEGETLKARMARGALPVEDALGLACQVAEALAAAHQKGIVHRDVKPANVIVDEQGAAKLVDFGAAKILGTELTKEGVVLGTVAYMSPEQTCGATTDHRTDLWSLGVVLYEMLAGQRPFQGGSDRTLIHAIRHDSPEPVERLRPEVSTDLSTIVRRCLTKEPVHRYAEADALLADLKAIQAGEHIRDRRRPVARYVGLAALCTLLLVGGLTLGRRAVEGGTAAESSAETVPAEYRIAVLPLDGGGDSDAAYLAEGMTEELIARLSALNPLRVVARASAMRFVDTDKSPAEIGRELGAAALLTGSVHRLEDTVRITVQLLEAERDAPLWTEVYDVPRRDVETVPGAIAGRVAEALNVSGEPPSRLQGSDDPEAYERYLRGRYFLNKRDAASLQRSKDYFERALDLDPTYAQAWVGLSNTYTLLGSYAVLTPEEAHPQRTMRWPPRSPTITTSGRLPAGTSDGRSTWIRATRRHTSGMRPTTSSR